MRCNDLYVETRTAGWRTNARHLICTIEQLFEKVRKVKKTPFKTKQAFINDAQGNIITEQEPALERWREYNEQLFAKLLMNL